MENYQETKPAAGCHHGSRKVVSVLFWALLEGFFVWVSWANTIFLIFLADSEVLCHFFNVAFESKWVGWKPPRWISCRRHHQRAVWEQTSRMPKRWLARNNKTMFVANKLPQKRFDETCWGLARTWEKPSFGWVSWSFCGTLILKFMKTKNYLGSCYRWVFGLAKSPINQKPPVVWGAGILGFTRFPRPSTYWKQWLLEFWMFLLLKSLEGTQGLNDQKKTMAVGSLQG